MTPHPGRARTGGTLRVACAALLIASACAPAGDRAPGGVRVDTLRGIVTITNLAGSPAASRVAAELSDPPLRIGRLEGEGPDVFGGIAAIAVGPDREVYVADDVALEIRVFAHDGEFVRAFGGKGEGPGQFEVIDGLVAGIDGSVLVRDPRLARVSRFGPDGGFEDSFRLERALLLFSDGTTFWTDSLGRVYDRVITGLGIDEPDRYGVVVYSRDRPPDTAFVVEHRPRRAFAREGERTVLSMTVPFTPEALVAVSAGGEIGAGLGAAYRIAVSDRTGDTLGVFARQVTPDPVEGAEEADAVARMRARVEELAPGAVLDDVELPDVKPVIAALRADARGGWWVGRYRGETDPDDATATFPTEWDVFDRSGRFLGTVSTPPIQVFQVGLDYVAGVATDELGVQYAVVYDLRRAG